MRLAGDEWSGSTTLARGLKHSGSYIEARGAKSQFLVTPDPSPRPASDIQRSGAGWNPRKRQGASKGMQLLLVDQLVEPRRRTRMQNRRQSPGIRRYVVLRQLAPIFLRRIRAHSVFRDNRPIHDSWLSV